LGGPRFAFRWRRLSSWLIISVVFLSLSG
jgi:hypothetical protein